MNESARALVLAAGRSKRMNLEKSKVLLQIRGKTLIEYVVEALKIPSMGRIGVVVNPQNREAVEAVMGGRVDYIIQPEPLGSGHAVLVAENWLKDFTGSLVVVVGDAPFIHRRMMQTLLEHQQNLDLAALFLSAIFDSPPPYGRVVRDPRGRVLRIVEEGEATAAERQIKEVSSSHYCFKVTALLPALHQVDRGNRQNEYYLPDVIGILTADGQRVDALPVDDPFLISGINDREDFEFGSREWQKRMSGKAGAMKGDSGSRR
jgi:bifunctional UDP-N-acetylglucosamine pyrophosphorylase/glucosamine-1-phosphate N-acetyltransferase